MRILGFQKTTLLDYPHKIAATIFLGGCNFRCPFCHNASLALNKKDMPSIPWDQIEYHLKKRINVLEGVCITGGEPTLNNDLPLLIRKIKSLGYLVKLDTNGSNPNMLSTLLAENLIDYVAMDIKNSPKKYDETCGQKVDLNAIMHSVDQLIHAKIPNEFRTTVLNPLHTYNDFIEIGEWLDGAQQYFLQNFMNSSDLICPNKFSSYDRTTLEQFLSPLKKHISFVSLRGVD